MSNNKEFMERRKYVRLDLRCKVKYTIIGTVDIGASHSNISVVSSNLSVDGIRFDCPEDLKAGTVLALEIFFPGVPNPLIAEAEVKWNTLNPNAEGIIDKYLTGLQFIKMDTDYAKILVDYVSGNWEKA